MNVAQALTLANILTAFIVMAFVVAKKTDVPVWILVVVWIVLIVAFQIIGFMTWKDKKNV